MRLSSLRIVCSVVVAAVSIGAFVSLAPAASGTRAALTRAAAEMKYWLNTDSNIRHNARCKYFNNTKAGRFCGPTDGRACKLCGG